MSQMSHLIITGERIQQTADIYIGTLDDFNYNPLIANQTHKHKYISTITEMYDNPPILFFYTHRVNEIASIVHLFKNPFTLLSHNSDFNIVDSPQTITILNCHKLKAWYTQNQCFQHPKLFMLPIGFANSMWPHGNLTLFDNTDFIHFHKTKRVYFNFQINTNARQRQPCYDAICQKVQWIHNLPPLQNLARMKEYEFCICPEGNGVDCHRFWEALYLKCVPIVINSPFIETLLRNRIPLVVLNKWEDLDVSTLNYSLYTFGEYRLDELAKQILY